MQQRDYWDAFHKVLDTLDGPVRGNRKPQPQSWMNYSIGRSGIALGTSLIRPKRQIRAELYLSSPQAKAQFYQLRDQQADIERELGYPLAWEELPSRRDCRIAYYFNDVDPQDPSDWPRQPDWLVRHVNDFHRVFARRVRLLSADNGGGGDHSTQ